MRVHLGMAADSALESGATTLSYYSPDESLTSARTTTKTTQSSAVIGALRPLPPVAMYGARVTDTTRHP